MSLKEQFERSGDWLFKWRSYLPLLLIGLFALALRDFDYLFPDRKLNLIWEILCLLVSLLGLGIRVYTVGHVPFGTSGRNTREQVAHELNTSGVYSVVRHPLYLGNYIIWLGLSLFMGLWWFTLLVSLIYWLYYERIIFCEERFLQEKFGDQFKAWAQTTPAFLPNLRKWQSPSLPFAYKVALRREYSTFFAIIVSFTILALAASIVVNRQIVIDWVWVAIFSVGLIIYLTIRYFKKYTKALQVEGR